jgi:hypothetical protein
VTIIDPFDALEKQYELEKLSSDPVLARIAELAEYLDLPWVPGKGLAAIRSRVNTDRVEKLEVMVDAIKAEVRGHEDRVAALRADVDRLQEWYPLLIDGAKKAEATRAPSRVERIGKILGTSLTITPFPKPDDVEEMMRIATELSDEDVHLLEQLVGVQGEMVRAAGRIPRFDAWSSWPRGPWGESLDGDRDSVFNKLESFGLVTRLAPPNNQNLYADLQNRYALLRKGLNFIRFVRG